MKLRAAALQTEAILSPAVPRLLRQFWEYPTTLK